jgi:hypothetical protein
MKGKCNRNKNIALLYKLVSKINKIETSIPKSSNKIQDKRKIYGYTILSFICFTMYDNFITKKKNIIFFCFGILNCGTFYVLEKSLDFIAIIKKNWHFKLKKIEWVNKKDNVIIYVVDTTYFTLFLYVFRFF